MTQEQIIESNKLIAEFMGATTGSNSKEGIFYYFPDRMPSYLPGELKYHQSFDWLMPVVEKIAKTGCKIQIHINTVDSDTFIDELRCVSFSKTIDSIYTACVQFITWYNQKQS